MGRWKCPSLLETSGRRPRAGALFDPNEIVLTADMMLAKDLTEALLKAIAAERSAFATMRAANPMGRGRTTAAELKKLKDATAAHDAAKAEVAKLRAKRPR